MHGWENAGHGLRGDVGMYVGRRRDPSTGGKNEAMTLLLSRPKDLTMRLRRKLILD